MRPNEKAFALPQIALQRKGAVWGFRFLLNEILNSDREDLCLPCFTVLHSCLLFHAGALAESVNDLLYYWQAMAKLMSSWIGEQSGVLKMLEALAWF